MSLNPHYLWEMKIQYLYNNLYILYVGGKMQYSQYDPLNPQYSWEVKLQNSYVKHWTFLMAEWCHKFFYRQDKWKTLYQ